MKPAYYSDQVYRKEQSETVKQAWKDGKFDSLIRPLERRICKNQECNISFEVKPYNPRVFCSHGCSARVSNRNRKQSAQTRNKISVAIKNLPSVTWEHKRLPLVNVSCEACSKVFAVVPYLAKRRKYCSNACSMAVIGARTTSPKASKGRSGVRLDIDQNITFYSTWEANVARVFNLVGIKWKYAPRIFDLGEHTYRPDFYLPEHDTYIEVKNFMGEYSQNRDTLFRYKFPNLQLELIMKKEYLELAAHYRPFVDLWE